MGERQQQKRNKKEGEGGGRNTEGTQLLHRPPIVLSYQATLLCELWRFSMNFTYARSNGETLSSKRKEKCRTETKLSSIIRNEKFISIHILLKGTILLKSFTPAP